MLKSEWTVILLDEVERWFLDLAQSEAEEVDAVMAAIGLLESDGPNLARPIADKIKGSRQHKMKELRPSGTSIRILFIFDPKRQAVLLLAGDKRGNWKKWYDENIPEAERRYSKWLAGDYDNEVS